MYLETLWSIQLFHSTEFPEEFLEAGGRHGSLVVSNDQGKKAVKHFVARPVPSKFSENCTEFTHKAHLTTQFKTISHVSFGFLDMSLLSLDIFPQF